MLREPILPDGDPLIDAPFSFLFFLLLFLHLSWKGVGIQVESSNIAWSALKKKGCNFLSVQFFVCLFGLVIFTYLSSFG